MPLRKDVDNSVIRKKMFLGLLSSPLTLLPLVGGSTVMAAALALSVRPDLGVLAGVLGVLVSAGSFVSQLLLDGVDRAKEAISEAEHEAHLQREAALNELDARLAADGDARTETLLRDLRQLLRAFDAQYSAGTGQHPSSALVDIQSKIEEMALQCVRSLEQSLSLWQTASTLQIEAAREPILARREEILGDVLVSIQQMGRILAGLEEVVSARPGVSSLGQARADLEQNLVVAKQVNARLRALESELSTSRE